MDVAASNTCVLPTESDQSASRRTSASVERWAGDEIDVTCSFVFGDGKTYRVEQELRRNDGVLVADVTTVGGLLDLTDRLLVPDAAVRWRALATAPGQLGL
jgi:acyl-CoA thioester hydrolase